MGRQEPTVSLREHIEYALGVFNLEIKTIKEDISSIKRIQSGHYEDCPNTQICRPMKMATDHWGITIMVICGSLLLTSSALATAYETWVKPKKEITVTIQELRQAMREEKDITLRGSSISKEQDYEEQKEIKSILNK